jgi:hypothetical protein
MTKMHTDKFVSTDRELVISELERIQQTKLSPVLLSRKLYVDTKGMSYFILGGTGDWHGISRNVIKELKTYSREGAFVIAKKYKSKIDLCVGSLITLIQNLERLSLTKQEDLQFHTVIAEDGVYILEIPELFLNRVSEIRIPGKSRDLSRLEAVSRIINIEVDSKKSITHADLQAKLILIGSYLGYRTYTPDQSKQSIYGILGDLCSETEIPESSIPRMHIDSARYIDVIWFDDEGFPTHGFEVEHTTDITKGLLRLYQVHKLRIKMFIVSDESSKSKFLKEIQKNPFHKIQEEYIFRNYEELDEFFESVKAFAKIQQKFFDIRGAHGQKLHA